MLIVGLLKLVWRMERQVFPSSNSLHVCTLVTSGDHIHMYTNANTLLVCALYCRMDSGAAKQAGLDKVASFQLKLSNGTED